MKSLDNILGDEVVESVEEAPVEVAVEAVAETPRDEAGRFAAKGEESASPAPVEQVKPDVEHPAYIGERRRRQEAEARIAELEARLQPQEAPPSIFEDENAALQHFGGQVVTTAVQQATQNAKLDMSEMLARQANPDFDAMKETFLNLMAENPTLQRQALADPHPWAKAYQIAKTHATMQQVGATDVDSLRAAIRAELEAEFQARPIPTNIPVSLAGAQSARASTDAPPARKSLDEILDR